ncbi:C40 family peptidase [Odoribacter lunatus]|uniref:C40 family peptidase n=1 Tax=Odoribacter lunatus TaxID=2941335 RepID=UPI002040A3C3|nr:C40 family peptidase [Odoribacter lunatus]
MKNRILLLIIGAALFCSSCSSHRHLSTSSSASKLSEKLNFTVSPKDKNLPLYTEAANWLGVPYKYGGNTVNGVDCSGLVSNIYRKVYQLKIERTVAGMYNKNCRKIPRSSLQPGDLVFFNTAKKGKSASHVGIFLKNNIFIHATTHSGVRLSTLDEAYYKKSWISGGKIKKTN